MPAFLLNSSANSSDRAMTPNPEVNRTVLGAASPASAAGYL
jgi:hypothetical protein